MAPGRPIIQRSHRADLPERADMRLASAGPCYPEDSIAPARNRRPAMIKLRLLADYFRLENLSLGRRCARPETNDRRRRDDTCRLQKMTSRHRAGGNSHRDDAFGG